MIGEIEAAIRSYPYADTYRSYPGPNSNTFLAHIGREVPALKLVITSYSIHYTKLYEMIHGCSAKSPRHPYVAAEYTWTMAISAFSLGSGAIFDEWFGAVRQLRLPGSRSASEASATLRPKERASNRARVRAMFLVSYNFV